MIKKTVKWIIDINKKLDEDFRRAIGRKKGAYRGAIKDAIQEAIVDWIKKE